MNVESAAARMDYFGLMCDGLPSVPRPGVGRILVTGATGYIGGRLVPELLARGYCVRVMVMEHSSEHETRWPGAEIAVADVMDPATLGAALADVSIAYYLIHSIAVRAGGIVPADLLAAAIFRRVAGAAGVERIIVLEDLSAMPKRLSAHLRCRREVVAELARGPVPTTALRAGIVIGSGSAPHEVLKHLAHTTRFLPLPRWARVRTQPISVRDVMKYLVGAVEMPETAGNSYDVGGTDILTFEAMLDVYGSLLGTTPSSVRLPFSYGALDAYILSLMTPVPVPITRCLVDDLTWTALCGEDTIARHLPFAPLPFRDMVARAMAREAADAVPTRWSDTYPAAHFLAAKMHQLTTPPNYGSAYSLVTEKAPAVLFRSICQIGGRKGWFRSNWMWALRGALDRLLMGVGTARGRRIDSTLRIDDVIDFWRVEDLRRDERLLLRAEMKLPGSAWLEFTIEPCDGRTRLSVKAHYLTRTFLGRAYWYAMYPFHGFIFRDLIRQIEKRS